MVRKDFNLRSNSLPSAVGKSETIAHLLFLEDLFVPKKNYRAELGTQRLKIPLQIPPCNLFSESAGKTEDLRMSIMRMMFLDEVDTFKLSKKQ